MRYQKQPQVLLTENVRFGHLIFDFAANIWINADDASPYDPLRIWAVLMAEKSVLSEKRTGF